MAPSSRPPRRARLRRTACAAALGLASLGLVSTGPSPAAADPPPEPAPARLSDHLTDLLDGAAAHVPLPVMVHADDVATASDAVDAAGMIGLTTFDRIGVAVAAGTPAQIQDVRDAPGVTYVEGDQPIELSLETSGQATRGDQAQAAGVPGAPATPLDGRGVSVAVIDSGVDGRHPAFRNPDGSSAVVRNLKNVCAFGTLVPIPSELCFLDLTAVNDTDTLSVGGHGTHVAGIVAGRPVTTTGADRRTLDGAAPGASIVSLSVGFAVNILGADAALNWVLENHEAPCGAGVSPETCPPIKVTNNSYGPSGGGAFDPESATVKLQRELAADGVVTVWAAGNDGGDGSTSLTNPPGQDPTPGIVSVAAYDDLGSGTRAGLVADFSSRGAAADQTTWPDVTAPGANIESACRLHLPICATGLAPAHGPGLLDIGTFNTLSGTSMAAPHVAGIVAQLFQADPDASAADIEDAVNGSAHKFGDGAAYSGTDAQGSTSYDKGHGLVDVVAAVARLTS